MFTNLTFRRKVIEIALGENKTLTKTMPEKIQKYRDSVNISPGTSWCVAFVYWCHVQACHSYGVANNPMPKTASSGFLFNFAKNNGLFVDSPEEGDIYISGEKHHTGLIVRANPDFANTRTRTIEGNTWVGDHVWGVHKRKKKLAKAFFIRL